LGVHGAFDVECAGCGAQVGSKGNRHPTDEEQQQHMRDLTTVPATRPRARTRPSPLYVTITGIDGCIWLRVYRGDQLVVETPLRARQTLLLLSDLANFLTIATEEGFTDAAG
jgi:hypothetical protein